MMLKPIEKGLEAVVFAGRWLLAPMYLGLVGGLLLLLVKFAQEFVHIVEQVFGAPERDIVLSLLSLIDITLVANLLVIVIFSGYENFVSKIEVADHEDRPEWMGKVDFSGLKIKLIGSIVAISAIELLRTFMHLTTPGAHIDGQRIGWMLGIQATFIISGVLFALMDRLAGDKHR
jgi:uncharacterized protein (TIGR00645 family)